MTKTTPTFVLAIINHLIAGEDWAGKLLDKHLGKVLMLKLPFGDFALQVRPGGLAHAYIDADTPIQVQLDVAKEAITAALSGGKSAATKHVKISGDVDFAHDLSTLANNLKWEAEEDLAKWVGDAPAHRISLEAKKFIDAGKRAVIDLKGGVRDYLVHEKDALIDISELESFKKELRELRDGIERAEKRVERLSQQITKNIGA